MWSWDNPPMAMGKPILVKFFIGVYTIFLSMLYEKSRVSQYERKDRPGKVKTQINLGLNSEFEKDKEVVVLYLDDFEDMEEQIQTPTGDEGRISELEAKIESLDSENTSLKAELENINLTQLEENIKELTQENKKLKEEANNTELEETISKLNTENESLKKKITELTTKNNGLTDKINEINPSQLKETISALQAENEILKENNKKLDDIPHIIDLQEQHKYELNKLNSQLLNEKDHVNRLMVGIIDMFNRGAINRFRNTIPDSLKEAMDEKLITGEQKLVNATINHKPNDN